MACRVSVVCLYENSREPKLQADSHTIQELTSGRCGWQ